MAGRGRSDSRIRADDGPYVLAVDHDAYGEMWFGPFRSYEKVLRAAERVELNGCPFWSIEQLQPGSFLPEWMRIFAEREEGR